RHPRRSHQHGRPDDHHAAGVPGRGPGDRGATGGALRGDEPAGSHRPAGHGARGPARRMSRLRFGQRRRSAVADLARIVVDVEPSTCRLETWSLRETAEGLREFSRRSLAAVAGTVAAIKPQSAFFELHGSAGVAVLEELLWNAREAEVLTILDVKRGDIGSTMGAYAQAHLCPGAPLAAD